MSWFDFLHTTSYTFEGKKENERVILFLHKHWFTVVSKLSFLTLLAISPLLLFVIFGQYIVSQELMVLFVFLWACLIMGCWYMFFYTLTMYTLDTWLVTNLRIINSAQDGFFQRSVSELNISNIQDVSIKTSGALPTMMNFGDIAVQTAGGDRYFTFENIPNPQEVKDRIVAVVDDFRLEHPNYNPL